MTNPEHKTRKAIAESTVTKIHGQPTNRDIDCLEDELIAIASNQHSKLGGGLHGHSGLVRSVAKYELMVPGTPFIFPANPGVYPQGPIPAAQHPQWEAKHKALVAQFQACMGASKGLKDLILKVVAVRTASCWECISQCDTIANVNSHVQPVQPLGYNGLC
jgi:hypothetical protein